MPNQNFSPKAVSEFLTSDESNKYIFEIPSFQRGYRWTSRQVEELFKDLCNFANDESEGSKIYYLQPLVVRGDGLRWEVLDGQQRLTTLKLIIHALKKYGRPSVSCLADYDIKYLIRPNFDFFKANSTDNLDSYYVANAIKTIDEYLKRYDACELAQMADVLFGLSKTKKIKFIWYRVEGDESTDAASIAIFNRLNRGKLKLTPSELIKALLIISADKTSHSKDFQTVLSMEWNEIEHRFMHDDFFSFINTGNKQYDTRTDLLFNHVALNHGVSDKDNDFAYRWFQDKYDNDESILDIWEHEVKDVYDMLMQWYSIPEMYNYIGFLSQYDVKIGTIRDRLVKAKNERKNNGGQWSKADNINVLKGLIADLFKPSNINGTWLEYPKIIDELDYHDHRNEILRVLLLFNVVSYSKQNLRFPFDKYVNEKWDIEHVDSQTNNPLSRNEDQKQWLVYTNEVLNDLQSSDKNIIRIKKEISKCLENDIKSSDWITNYRNIYRQVIETIKPENPVIDKDSVGNLTLLDSSTNRGYGNALFPYKRKCVVGKDNNGGFVPTCTLNLFMKYYTSNNNETSGYNGITWSENDAQAYLAAIHNALDPFFN